MLEFVKAVFRTSSFLVEMNKTLISLILKQQPPKQMFHFRPISLCNVVVKIISQVLANILNPLMLTLTFDCQSSFVPNQQAADNIIVFQEAIYSLRKRKDHMGG